jgi:hypothetical protein
MGQPRSAAGVLDEWLNRAARGLVRREGMVRETDPYRHRLLNAADAY